MTSMVAPTKSQYQEDFKQRKLLRQVGKKISSGTRRNNPQPGENLVDKPMYRALHEKHFQDYIRGAVREYLENQSHQGQITPNTIRWNARPEYQKRQVRYPPPTPGAKNGISYPALQVAPRQEEPPVDKNAPAEQYHWSVWKSPDTADITQRSPEANRRTNPMIRKTPTIYEHVRNEPENGSQSVLPGNNVEDNEDIGRGAQMTYVPELQSWIHASNDYERQTAKTVINAMNGDANKLLSSRDFNQRPMTTGLTNAKRMQDYFRRRTAQQKRSATVAPPNGKTYYNQSWLPYEDLKGQGEEKYLKGVAKRLEREDVPPVMHLFPPRSAKRARAKHQPRPPPEKDFVHNLGFFMTTNPIRSSYVIHPDWVSEQLVQKKHNRVMDTTRGPNALRYSCP